MIRFFPGGLDGGKHSNIGFRVKRYVVRRLRDAQHANKARRILGRIRQRHKHDRGRAVADQRAIVHGKRFGDEPACKRLFHGDDLAHVRQRVPGAVGMIFYRDRGKVLPRGSVLMHVAARDHTEKGRKGGPGAALSRHVARARQNLSDPRCTLRCHLLNARHQHRVVDAVRYALPGMKEGRAAGGASIFDAGTGNLFQARSRANIRREMVLPDKGRTCEITQVQGLDSPGLDVCVREGVGDCFDRERSKIAVRKRAKRRFSDPDDRNWSHIHLRIALMARPPCTFPDVSRQSLVEECSRTRAAFLGIWSWSQAYAQQLNSRGRHT